MPLLITPPAPFQTSAQLPVASLYAIILTVGYSVNAKTINFEVGYYAHEAARVARAEVLVIPALETRFFQQATPEQANAVPIFQFLEQVLTAQLATALPEGTTIENVA